jgi:Raf kinase inhibitor-like YbhB/YbcL family protein
MTRTLRARMTGKRLAAALIAAGALAIAPLAATAASGATAHPAGRAGHFHPFTIISPDFHDGGFLPVSAEFGGPGSQGSGCSGKNLAPRLTWYNVPAGTKSFAFTINDVDAPVAGGFHHWVVYNIPRGHPFLAGHGQNPFSEGTNSYGTVGYGGPCPPPVGQIHHYVFTVYALSATHITGVHITYERLLREIAPDVLGATSTIGKFRLPLPS